MSLYFSLRVNERDIMLYPGFQVDVFVWINAGDAVCSSLPNTACIILKMTKLYNEIHDLSFVRIHQRAINLSAV